MAGRLLSMASISQRSILIGILVSVCTFTATAWIATTVSPMKYTQRSRHNYPHSGHSIGWSTSTTQLSYRDDDHDSLEPKKKSSPPSDFQSRMKRAALQSIRSSSTSSSSSSRRGTGTSSWRPSNIKTAASLEEFANVIQEGRSKNQLVVVRFYATWCKKCHSIRPSFDKVASSKPQVIFVDVPVTNTNVELHQNLGVQSVPFAHIYCPERGLVVEERISRSRFSEFEELVEKYSSS
jgi:thiol-disulfide isomerase/thioredoxin